MNDATIDHHEADPLGTVLENAPAAPFGFELLEEVGRGGMGIVYRARDLALDRLEKAIRKNYLHRARIENDSALKTLWDSHPRRLARIVKELDQRLAVLRARK